MIGAGTVVGPHAVIGEHVRLGRAAAWVPRRSSRPSEIGDGNEIFPFVSIGLIPQYLKFHGEPTKLVVAIGTSPRVRVRSTEARRGGGVTEIAITTCSCVCARRARLSCRITNFRNAANARRPRHGRRLRDHQRVFRGASVLPGRQARLHRRFSVITKTPCLLPRPSAPRRALRFEHDRPGERKFSSDSRPSCAAPTGICCMPTEPCARTDRARPFSQVRRSA